MEANKFRGLLNRGENNCFINVVVQILWTVPEARKLIMTQSHSHSPQISCLTCEISNLFANMTYSDSNTFSATSLRHALTNHLPTSNEFEENKMGCAIEAFEQILNVIHSESLQPNSDSCSNSCVTHKIFGFQFYEDRSCCDNFEIGNIESDFLMRIYARDLEEASKKLFKPGSIVDFNQVLGLAMGNIENVVKCKSCGNDFKAVKKWIQSPKVWGISIVWDPTRCGFARNLLLCLNEFLYSRGVFYAEEQQTLMDKYIFRGMICFHYSHYSAFIYQVEENSWYQVDDSVIKKMKSFKSMLNLIMNNNSLPVLLLYEHFNENYQTVYKKNEDLKLESVYDARECFNCQLL